MTKIKLCGLQSEDHIRWANEAGCDYVGFVFAKSRRQVSFSQAARIRKHLESSIIPVGVFVDSPIEEILSLVENNIISMIQLHGSEDEVYIKSLRSYCDVPIVKAVRVIDEMSAFLAQKSSADYLLFDAKTAGSGISFDWSLTRKCSRPFFLAGGLNLTNLSDAILQVHPYAVDLSSGLEIEGEKNCRIMREATRLSHSL